MNAYDEIFLSSRISGWVDLWSYPRYWKRLSSLMTV